MSVCSVYRFPRRTTESSSCAAASANTTCIVRHHKLYRSTSVSTTMDDTGDDDTIYVNAITYAFSKPSGKRKFRWILESDGSNRHFVFSSVRPPPVPEFRKELWTADPSTRLDMDTSRLGFLPSELLTDFVLPLLSRVDLTMFLLSMGYNQYTSGFVGEHAKYTHVAPLPQWLSDWLWDHRANTHLQAANESMSPWDPSLNYGDWVAVRRRITFDGDESPQVYRQRRIAQGRLW